MTKYARLLPGGQVAEIISVDPKIAFVESIAKQFQVVPDNVEVGSKKTSKGFEALEVVLPEEEPIVFLLGKEALAKFMTRAERIAYAAVAENDPIVADFKMMLELDPQDLNSADTIEAIEKLQALKVLTAARATALKALED